MQQADSAHLLAGPQAGEGDADDLDVHGGRDHAEANVLGDVVAEGVAQVRRQVCQGALHRTWLLRKSLDISTGRVV